MDRLAIICAVTIIAGVAMAIYGEMEMHRAALVRVAACQMLPNRQLWDQFECSRAFEEAQQ